MDIQQLELLCKQMYEAQDHAVRSEAEKALVAFQESGDALTQCQMLLDRGESSYSQLLAATTLSKLISKNVQGLSLRQRVDIRNYILNYLATRMSLQSFVVQALVTLLAKITKYGWFDMYKDEMVFRNILEDVKKFLQQGSVEHCMIGVQILSQLTVVMNQVAELDANLTFTKHRETACSFRDTQLFDIFLLSCSLLSTARDNSKSLNFAVEPQFGLMNHILRLTRNCLSFDFIGTSNDESTDDMSTVQIPTNWRPAFLDMNTLKLFFDLYHILPARLSSLSLSTLVQITSVRRSLVTNAERAKFLAHLVTGIRDILENPAGLSEPDNFHEFCRLLARLKTNFQLAELINVDAYADAIALIAKFTVESLRVWQFSPNSIHYLLSLWQRLVASVQFFKDAKPHLLERFTPEVTAAYVNSRLDAVPIILRDGMEDPLDDLGMVQQQLEQLCVIERCEYEKTVQLLVQLFDRTAGGYQEALAAAGSASSVGNGGGSGNNGAGGHQLAVHENRLTWLVYIIGSAISSRMSFTTNEEHDVMDGELVVRVLQLMHVTDGRLAQARCERLELAIITFLDQLRKMYIIEQTQKMKIYTRLSELLGINDEQMLLSVINRKIITNLKFWGRSEMIIRKTLSLLNELSISFNCVRKLVKLDEIQFILNNHTSEHFSFLSTNVAVSEMRFRSLFYTSLGRLLMVDLGEDEERFYNCLQPLTNAFESIGTMLMDTNNYPSEETKKALIGLARDLRGLAYASTTRSVYMMFFDWIYPNYTPIMLRALELWSHDPAVTTPVLKLFAELVQNRSQRLLFELSSPNGILLFREASKAICCYGSRILTLDVPKDQQYPMRLKGISVCFIMLKAALSGNYVNFGVFKLYGDDTLENVLNIAAKLIVSIPRRDLIEYPKLSKAYYLLLECLAQDHIAFLTALEPAIFVYILESLCEGLIALDTTVCTGCCSTLDNIVTFIFKQLALKVSTFQAKKFRRSNLHESDMYLVMELHREVLQRILSTILNTVMFEDCKNQWSMSRPLLGLILLNEEYFSSLKENIIRSQSPEKQQALATWFNNLMDGVERNLLMKNRDRFTQNLSLFRRDINDSLKAAQFACSPHGNAINNANAMSMNDMIVS